MPPLFFGLVTFLFCGYAFGLIPNPFLMLTLVTFFTVTGGTLTYLLIKILNRAAIYDNPNDRSMHSIPTPRGGGWSYVILLAVGFGLVLSCGFSQSMSEFNLAALLGGRGLFGNIGRCIFLEHETLLLFAGFILLALVSWWDDCRGLPARVRLLAQFLAVAIPLHSYPVEILFPDWLPYPVALVLVLLAWIWFINLYNFMDGIDGITAMETICISGVIALLGLKYFNNVIVLNDLVLVLSIVLFSVSVGFLQFNWHPAQIFLGDVGSVSIGYILGFCLLHIAALGYWQIALTLPLYYIADSGITLVRRLLHGDKVWEAHRTHLYQVAAQMSGRHDIVVLKIAGCNLILAIIALVSIFWGAWVCFAAPIPVALLYAHFAKQARMAYLSIWQS